MTLEEPSAREVKEAIEYIEELRKDPQKYDRWLDVVLDKALKGWRGRRTWKAAKTKRS